MKNVTIIDKFYTTAGLILQIKNDRIFKVGEVISAEGDKYQIQGISFSSNPNMSELVILWVIPFDVICWD